MTLGVDFDGVVHGYRLGWHDGSIYDRPVPGAIDALRMLMQAEPVFIHTARDLRQVADWLTPYGFATEVDSEPRRRTFWNERGVLLVTDRKYPARCYVDDRGIRFTRWDTALHDIARLSPQVAELLRLNRQQGGRLAEGERG